jgi:pimeloyl-ACP methyl ester carboxylesterase
VTRFVVLPGLDGTGELLHEFATALAPLGSVDVLSYATDRALGYAALCDTLAAQARIDADCVIVAESFAGPLGIALAARAKQPPRALVLSASFAVCPLPWLRRFAPMTHWLPIHQMPRAVSNALVLGRWATPVWSRRLDAALARVPAVVLRARLRAALEVDWRHALQSLTSRVLYLQAGADRVIPRYAARCIAAVRPDLQRVRIDAPHFLLQAAPQTAVDAIGRFLDETV